MKLTMTVELDIDEVLWGQEYHMADTREARADISAHLPTVVLESLKALSVPPLSVEVGLRASP